MKSLADYGAEPQSVSAAAANEAIGMAERMIDVIGKLLGATDERVP